MNKMLRRGRAASGSGKLPRVAERDVLCSGCAEVVPESRIKVLPLFNNDLAEFVTAYRCEKCWREALDETAFRLLTSDDRKQIISVAEFFERHGIVVLEYRRGDALAEVRILLLQLLAKLRNGDLSLEIGETKSF